MGIEVKSPPKPERRFTLTENTLNVVVNYLQKQPYNQVAGLLQSISNDLQDGEKSAVRKIEEKAKEA